MTRGQHLAAQRARQLQLARRARLLEALHRLPAAALFALLLELERRYDLVDLDGQLERVVNKAAP